MQPPSSFFETTPPQRRAMSRSESDSRIIRHTRSFSKFLFFGGAKGKEDERLVDDMVSPQRRPSKKTQMRTGGAPVSIPDPVARDAPQSSSPSKSMKARALFSTSTTSMTSVTLTPSRPTRPTHRPSLSILTGRNSFAVEDLSPSPTRTRTMYVKSAHPAVRERVVSTGSETSSPGPQTPYDESGSSLAPLSASTTSKSLWFTTQRTVERTPAISSAPLQRNHTAPIIETSSRAASQPSTPVKRLPGHGLSHSVDWRLQSSFRPPITHHAHSYSVSNDPSPLACLIDEEYSQPTASTLPMPDSPTSAPTLRHALLIQQEKYRMLKTQLREMESAKEQRDREIAFLKQDADKRAEELRGLKLILAETEKDKGREVQEGDPTSDEMGSPLTRSKSMSFLSAPTHDVDVPSSARPGETFESPDASACKSNLGLGIDLDAGTREKSKRYGKAMMRPPPPPPPRGKLPVPETPSRCRSKSVCSKRSKECSSKITQICAVPVAPLNITRKKDQISKRVDPLAEIELLSKELKELRSSTSRAQQ